ncbi:nitroreductase family protein [Phenylobacterium sp.]|jgi:nitroreductase|uniref:nitroreductase family protein n=1 Tax=Phenylobacterium sp. TaxID=1871053 RepID=UPI002F3F7BAE
MSADPKLFDTIFSTRAMRRLKPDPVADALIEQILRAGQAAPSGSNSQAWGFLVVRDPEIKKAVQAHYQRAYDAYASKHYAAQLAALPPGEDRDKLERQTKAVAHLTEHFHEAPVWIVACQQVGPQGAGASSGASIYPAVQNMLLAARALGLGSTLTARHMAYGKEVDAVFGLPEGVVSFAILPIGYPLGNFGPIRRGPLSAVTHLDRWGQPYL